MDEHKCMVDVARFFMEFCRDESCGKCTPCRVGTDKMLEILDRLCVGRGRASDIATLEKWAGIMQNTALCGLGQTAPNPVLSTLRYFRDEYEAHIHDRRCEAGVCRTLAIHHALEDKCLPCLQAVAGYDAGGFEGLQGFLPELVPEPLAGRIGQSGCAVDLARFSMLVPARNSSCTKCVSCRLGSTQVLNVLEDIASGRGTPELLEILAELIQTMSLASECAVGKSGSALTSYALEQFREQFEDHIRTGTCAWGICRPKIDYHEVCPLHPGVTGKEVRIHDSREADHRRHPG